MKKSKFKTKKYNLKLIATIIIISILGSILVFKPFAYDPKLNYQLCQIGKTNQYSAYFKNNTKNDMVIYKLKDKKVEKVGKVKAGEAEEALRNFNDTKTEEMIAMMEFSSNMIQALNNAAETYQSLDSKTISNVEKYKVQKIKPQKIKDKNKCKSNLKTKYPIPTPILSPKS